MTNTQEPTKRIIKITLTGIETLTYHIGCDEAADDKAIYFRVVANSGNAP